jgi:hypothetical protein
MRALAAVAVCSSCYFDEPAPRKPPEVAIDRTARIPMPPVEREVRPEEDEHASRRAQLAQRDAAANGLASRLQHGAMSVAMPHGFVVMDLAAGTLDTLCPPQSETAWLRWSATLGQQLAAGDACRHSSLASTVRGASPINNHPQSWSSASPTRRP